LPYRALRAHILDSISEREIVVILKKNVKWYQTPLRGLLSRPVGLWRL